MTHNVFWEIIADSRSDWDPNRRDGNMDLQEERLRQLLSEMPGEQVQQFDSIFHEMFCEAYRWDLWAAAYIIGGGCSDDSFMDFRYWLISMGQEDYEAAMADPESLTESAARPGVESCFFESFGYVAGAVLREREIEELPIPEKYRLMPEPAGESWEENKVSEVLPRLWSKFGH